MIDEAKKLGLQIANEVFADRTYQTDGSLTPRTQPHALISNADEAIKQVVKFIKENKVTAVTGEDIFIKAGTICIHGDGKHAVEFAKAIYKKIHEI
jgi:5-oxoprolinase (ATP-hydrolysing) subunit A